ncbi:MAG: hypothetical protein M5R42_19980 [Rhodocyclaceae bacterium]|nr:hypothetical protein [Rhodocyclaceae bacterium]
MLQAHPEIAQDQTMIVNFQPVQRRLARHHALYLHEDRSGCASMRSSRTCC